MKALPFILLIILSTLPSFISAQSTYETCMGKGESKEVRRRVGGFTAYPFYTEVIRNKPSFISYNTTRLEGNTLGTYATFNLNIANNAPNGNHTFYVDFNMHAGASVQQTFTLEIKITIGSNLPGKPATPVGADTLCKNSMNTVYSTSGITGVATYVWEISPSNAGTITGTGKTATVDWASNFTGTARIKVSGQNSCGTGVSSEELIIKIDDIPAKPSRPSGNSILCNNSNNTLYSTLGATNANSYIWKIFPSNAGIISGSGKTLTVNWSNTFSGAVKIIVSGQNDCGIGLSSDTLQVQVNSAPNKPTRPNGDTQLCKNPTNTQYSIPSVNGATNYAWTISPANAGVFIGTGTTVTVNWNNTFVGTAKITVAGKNTCGQGVMSEALEVLIGDTIQGSISGNNSNPICLGKVIVLTASGGTSYHWEGPNNFTSNVRNVVITNVTSSMGGEYIVTITNNQGCSTKLSTTVTIQSCIDATSYINKNDGVELFPNPSHGVITLKINNWLGKINVSIVDLYGQEVYKEKIMVHQNDDRVELKANKLPNGTYWVKLQDDRYLAVKKLIIL